MPLDTIITSRIETYFAGRSIICGGFFYNSPEELNSGKTLQQRNELLETIQKCNKIGKQILVVTPDNAKEYWPSKADVATVLNTQPIIILYGYEKGWNEPMRSLFLHALDHQLPLFVFSPQTYEKLIREVFFNSTVELPKYDSRALNAFGILERGLGNALVSPLAPTPSKIYEHDWKILQKLRHLVKQNQEKITFAIQTKLKIEFPALIISNTLQKDLNFDVKYLTPAQLSDLFIDLQFNFAVPGINPEDYCARLNNFIADTPERKQGWEIAMKIVNAPNLYLATGAYLSGPAAIGKTHLTIAVAKELMRQNFNVLFVSSVTQSNFWTYIGDGTEKPTLGKTCIIIDDLNSANETAKSLVFKKALLDIHKMGGILFVTSNQSYEYVIKDLCFTSPGTLGMYNSRAHDIFGWQSRGIQSRKQKSEEPVAYNHDKGQLEALNNLIKTNKPNLNAAIILRIQYEFPDIIISEPSAGQIGIDASHISPEALSSLIKGLSFYFRHPGASSENIFSTIDSFKPQATNKQQAEAYGTIKQLITHPPSSKYWGVFLSGDANQGKTHLITALAKALNEQGHSVYYISDNIHPRLELSLSPSGKPSVYIFDDIHNINENTKQYFKDCISFAYRNGGVILVTSNESFDYIMDIRMSTSDYRRAAEFKDQCLGIFSTRTISIRSTGSEPMTQTPSAAKPKDECSPQ